MRCTTYECGDLLNFDSVKALVESYLSMVKMGLILKTLLLRKKLGWSITKDDSLLTVHLQLFEKNEEWSQSLNP